MKVCVNPPQTLHLNTFKAFRAFTFPQVYTGLHKLTLSRLSGLLPTIHTHTKTAETLGSVKMCRLVETCVKYKPLKPLIVLRCKKRGSFCYPPNLLLRQIIISCFVISFFLNYYSEISFDIIHVFRYPQTNFFRCNFFIVLCR